MKIPFNYLPQQFKNTKPYFKEWSKLIRSTDFTLGKFVYNFEKKMTKYLKVKHCISTNNGTDALRLCLKSLGVSKGDEVITVCNSFYATVGAIVDCGAKPVLVDCDTRYQINTAQIEKKITKKTKVILPVHWGGASPDMFAIQRLANKYKVHIVEDACMGIGGKIKKKRPGTFGIANAFSMHPLKSLNVMGDGGMVTTNNDKIANWMRKFRNHGMIDRDNIQFWGANLRLQPLQAVVALEELKKLNRIIKIRNQNAKYYDNNLRDLYPDVIIPERVKNYTETYALYMCLFKKRDELKKYLLKCGIETKIHYPKPLHLQEAAKKLGHSKGSFPLSENQSRHLLTLPVHQYLSKNQLSFIIKKLRAFYNK